MRARRILLLLLAWLSFDLATPLPGAFEFEIQSSEIEHSLQAGRESDIGPAPAASRSPRERVEVDRAPRPAGSPAPAIGSAVGKTWLRQVRLAHRPSSSRASSTEDH